MRDVKPTDNKYLDEQTQRFRKWQKNVPFDVNLNFVGLAHCDARNKPSLFN
jgi:hypothetical protein